MSDGYIYAGLLACAIVTWFLRTAAFVAFKKGQIPDIIRYLGKNLPAAIMIILVVYSMRHIRPGQGLSGLAELLSTILIVLVHVRRKNMLISMLVGTLSYMVFIRIF